MITRDDPNGVPLRVHQALAAAVLLLAIWLSSGTLAPYAATLSEPLVIEPCHYLANVDDPQFVATYALLDGQPPSAWAQSVVLRRILYPLVAYPFMKAAVGITGHQPTGILYGGLIATMLLNAAALILFTRFVAKRHGVAAGVAASWLIATYPGITYWAGLPYPYAAIIPLTLFATIALFRIDHAQTERELAGWSLFLGVLFTGYDLLPFFGAAAFLLVLRRRSVRASALSAVCMLLPVVVVGVVLRLNPHIPETNSNTGVYGTILGAYFGWPEAGWMALLGELPIVAMRTFLYSNFVVLPLLWIICLVWRRQNFRLERAELALLLAVGAVFLFNNAAPPYRGWQLRGDWIARLYQPLFAVLVLGAARWTTSPQQLPGKLLLSIAVILNASVAFGPLVGNPLAFHLHERFYRHAPEGSFALNLDRFGTRPLGACEKSHQVDLTQKDDVRKNEKEELPRYMFVPHEAPR